MPLPYIRKPPRKIPALQRDSRRLKNSHDLKRPSSIGSDPGAGNSRGAALALGLFDEAQEKTGSGEKGGGHPASGSGGWLHHLSLSDSGMRMKNGNNKTERERDTLILVNIGVQTESGL